MVTSLGHWRSGGDFAQLDGAEDGDWVYNDRAGLTADVVACIRLEHVVTSNRDETLVLARLSDDPGDVEGDGFKKRWRQFLAVMNLYQFCEGFTFWATSEVENETAPDLPLEAKPAIEKKWEAVLADVIGSARRVATGLAAAGVPAPVVAFELAEAGGDAVAEMAWPQLEVPVAVLAGDQESLADAWRAQGWEVFGLENLVEEGLAALIARLMEHVEE